MAFWTDSAPFVQSISMVLGPLGILGAILCGLAFANYVSNASASSGSSSTGPVTAFVVLALLFGWIGMYVIYAWVLVAGAVLMAYLAARYGRAGLVPPRGVRYLLISGAFLGGVLPGLALYFILSFIVSDRYCQLTSSKCL